MLRKWVFEASGTEIEIEAYTLSDAWKKVAGKLPLNCVCVKLKQIKYL